MFSDPQSITVNSVAKSMPRVSTTGTASVYKKADETFQMTISHTKAQGGRIRSVVRVDQKAIVPDPLTSVNDYETLTVYTVIDRPLAGFTSADVNYLVAALSGWLDSTAVGKLFGQES
jgi:hypothetical protein